MVQVATPEPLSATAPAAADHGAVGEGHGAGQVGAADRGGEGDALADSRGARRGHDGGAGGAERGVDRLAHRAGAGIEVGITAVDGGDGLIAAGRKGRGGAGRHA